MAANRRAKASSMHIEFLSVAFLLIVFAVTSTNGSPTPSLRSFPPFAPCNATYGTQGQFLSSNMIGSRLMSVVWRDTLQTDIFWNWAGQTLRCASGSAELWAYNSTSHQWAFVAGVRDNAVPCTGLNAQNTPIHNNTVGYYNASFMPSGRLSVAVWTPADQPGVAYMYGGVGYGVSQDPQWSWDSSRRMWAYWGNGTSGASTLVNAAPGVFSTSNFPGARFHAGYFLASDNTMWLLAGTNGPTYLNDLWGMKIINGRWNWKCAIASTDGMMVLGSLGIESAANRFPAGTGVTPVVDYYHQGDAWIFGGRGICPGALATASDDCQVNALFRLDCTTGLLTYFGGNMYNFTYPFTSADFRYGALNSWHSSMPAMPYPSPRLNPWMMPGRGTANRGIQYMMNGDFVNMNSFGRPSNIWALNTRDRDQPKWMLIAGTTQLNNLFPPSTTDYFQTSPIPGMISYLNSFAPHVSNPYVYSLTTFNDISGSQSTVLELSVMAAYFVVPPSYAAASPYYALTQPVVSVVALPQQWTDPINDPGLTVELSLDPPVSGVTLVGASAPIINGLATFTAFNVSRAGNYSLKVEVVAADGFRAPLLHSDPFFPAVTVPCCSMAAVSAALQSGNTTVVLGPGRYTGNCDTLTGGITFGSNPASLRGAGAGVTILDCQSKGGRVLFASYASSSQPFVVSDMSITGGYPGSTNATGMAASFYEANLYMENVIITSNNGTDAPGISSDFAGNLTIQSLTTKNCTFVNNTALRDGGGIKFWGELLSVDGCTFSGNSAGVAGNAFTGSRHGSAIKIDIKFNTVSYTITNCKITNNWALYHSAVLTALSDPWWSGCLTCYPGFLPNVYIINTVFANNVAGDQGGGLLLAQSTTSILRGVSFVNNTACTFVGGASGGAHLIVIDSLLVDGCSFKSNTVGITGFQGAGAYISSVTRAVVRSTVFSDNAFVASSNTHGGGMEVDNVPYLDVINCTFANHNVSFSGAGLNVLSGWRFGSVPLNDSYVNVTGSTFVNNTVPTFGGVGASALFQLTTNVYLANSTFTGSTAYYGALELSILSYSEVKNCRFVNNVAPLTLPGGNYTHGGHIHSSTVPVMRFSNCYFGPSFAEMGAAFYWGWGGITTVSNITFTDCVFTGSTAITGGSVVATHNPVNVLGTLNLVRCNFTGNTVLGSAYPPSGLPVGGVINMGMAFGRSSVYISDCNFTGNVDTDATSYGGILVSQDFRTVSLRNVYIADNSIAGPLIWVNQTSINVNISGSTFLRNNGARGGVLYSFCPVQLSISSTTIASTTSGTGAAIAVTGAGSTVTVDQSTFKSNEGWSVFRVSSAQVRISASTFQANNNPSSDGGAVFASLGSTLNVLSSTFIGNQAHRGAGIFAADTALTVNGTTFSSNGALDVFGGGAIWQNGSRAIIATDTVFVQNNNSNMNPKLDGFFGGVGGCTSFASGTQLPPAPGCPGAAGYACSVQCSPDKIANDAQSLVYCPSGPTFTASPCVASDLVRSSYVGGNTTLVTPSYGTLGVTSPSNMIGARFGAAVFGSPALGASAVVFGGAGYNEAMYYDYPGNQLFGYGVLLDDTWVINMTTSVPTMTWMKGNRSATTPTMANYAAGIPGGRVHPATFVDGDFGYMHGGFGHGAGPYRFLACMWRVQLSRPQLGWTFVAGGQSGNEDGPYGTKFVFASANAPGGRYGHAMWTLPTASRGAFLYGGLGLANNGAQLYGYLNDLWYFNLTLNQWAWIGGNQTAGVVPPVYGSLGFNAINWPGARGGHAVLTSSNYVYLYGGHANDKTVTDTNSFSAFADLWKGQYDAVRQTIAWAWIGGSQQINSRGAYGVGAPSSANFGAARAFSSLLLSPQLSAVGSDWLSVYGGFGAQPDPSVNALSDVVRYDSSGRGSLVSGNIPANVYVTFPPLGLNLQAYNPGSRGRAMTWPDYTRAGTFYTFGGLGSYADGIRPGNDLWRITVARLALAGTVTGYTATVGVPVTISGVMRMDPSLIGVADFTFTESRVSVSAVSNATGAPANNLTLYSPGFVNGDLILSLDGPIPSAASQVFTVTITVYDSPLSFPLTLLCGPACSKCNSSSVGLSCLCNTGYVRSGTDCTSTCSGGQWSNGGVCASCATGCVTCTGPSLSYGDCQRCDEANHYARASSTGPCTSCSAAGLYMDATAPQRLCVPCVTVPSCKGGPSNVTCTTDQDSQCAACNPGTWLSNGVADTCRTCTACPTLGYWQVAPCAATADATCQTCTVCASNEYVASPCNASADTVCAACAPVANCDTSRTTCSNGAVSLCSLCVSGAFFKQTGGGTSSDLCLPCDSCAAGTFQVIACLATSNVTCSACHYGCAQCTGLGNDVPHVCQECDAAVGYLLSRDGTTCVASCAAVGEYRGHANVTHEPQCQPCSTGCLTCTGEGYVLTGSHAVCGACDEASGWLQDVTGSNCVDTCPPGQFRNDTSSPRQCVACAAKQCKSNEYVSCSGPDDGNCVACSQGCASCTGAGVDLHEYCSSCAAGYAPDASGVCTACIANCTTCSDNPATCSVCASGYANPPSCEPVCSSPGCIGCFNPEACGLCMGTYKGADCGSCSDQATKGSLYPECQPVRVTDETASGSALGVILLLVILVSIAALWSPLPVFYTGLQKINTPSAVFTMKLDFILTTRQLTLQLDQPIATESITLEGPGFETAKLTPTTGAAWEKAAFEVVANFSRAQMHQFLRGQFHVDITANAGSGNVVTAYPLRIPMRRNIANYLTMLTIFIDFVQLSALCFSGDISWWKSDPVPTVLHYSLLILPPNLNLWYITFWILVVLAGLWVIFVAVVKTGLDVRISKCRGGNKILAPIYSVFMPFVGQTLYLPIISAMLSVMSCSKPVINLDAPYTANFDSGLQCWHGEHWIYVVLAAVIVLLYYPLAVYTSPMWQTTNPELDVRYFPHFLIGSGQVKFILAVTGQLFAKVLYVQSALLIALCTPLALVVAIRPPTIINSLRWPLLASYLCVAWTGISSGVALFFPNQWISSVVLYGGWALLGLTSMVVALKPAPDPTRGNVAGTEEAEAIVAVRRLMQGKGTHGNKVGTYEAPEETSVVVDEQAENSTTSPPPAYVEKETRDVELPEVSPLPGNVESKDDTGRTPEKAGAPAPIAKPAPSQPTRKPAALSASKTKRN